MFHFDAIVKPESFDDAKAFRGTLRPNLPVAYSNMRTNQPIPPTTLAQNEHVDENAVEAKPILVAVQLDENDIEAINELISNENIAAEDVIDLDSSIEENFPDQTGEPLSQTDDSHNEQQLTETIGEIEMTYIAGQLPMPTVRSTPMVPKRMDELSGKMPYQAILDRSDVRMKKKKYSVVFCCVNVQTIHFFDRIERSGTTLCGASW